MLVSRDGHRLKPKVQAVPPLNNPQARQLRGSICPPSYVWVVLGTVLSAPMSLSGIPDILGFWAWGFGLPWFANPKSGFSWSVPMPTRSPLLPFNISMFYCFLAYWTLSLKHLLIITSSRSRHAKPSIDKAIIDAVNSWAHPDCTKIVFGWESTPDAILKRE